MQLKPDKMDSETQIIQQKENPLFDRKEVKVSIKSSSNPSFTEAEKVISDLFKSSPENIKILGIDGKFGRDHFIISSNIYQTKEDKDKIERKPKEKKKK